MAKTFLFSTLFTKNDKFDNKFSTSVHSKTHSTSFHSMLVGSTVLFDTSSFKDSFDIGILFDISFSALFVFALRIEEEEEEDRVE